MDQNAGPVIQQRPEDSLLGGLVRPPEEDSAIFERKLNALYYPRSGLAQVAEDSKSAPGGLEQALIQLLWTYLPPGMTLEQAASVAIKLYRIIEQEWEKEGEP